MNVKYALVLALGMLITGSINTISTKLADIQNVTGVDPDTPHAFAHPFFQAVLMFLGESLCLLTYHTQKTFFSSERTEVDSDDEEMGPVEYGENQEEVFLGRSVTQTQSISEAVAQKIDKEIRKLVDEGYNQAKKILTEKIDDLHKIAKALMTYETLTGEEIENIINKNVYPKDKILDISTFIKSEILSDLLKSGEDIYSKVLLTSTLSNTSILSPT